MKQKILFIKAMPIKRDKKDEVSSFGTMAINQFQSEYKKHHPNDEIFILDLNLEKRIHKILNGDNISEF
jgi:FMN-dependent NADH-azoreductase